jgi:hypothetical protein
MERHARVAAYYGFNPFGLTADQLLGLEYWQPRLETETMLSKARAGEIRLTPKGWHDLTLYVTGSQEAAQAAHNEAVLAALESKEQVGETV